MQDAQGHALTIASEEAARAHDHVIDGFLKYRFETGARLKSLLALDPEAPMAQAFVGIFSMLAYDRGFLPRAEAALARAESLRAERERSPKV